MNRRWDVSPVFEWIKAHHVTGKYGEPGAHGHIGMPDEPGRQRWERAKARGWLSDEEAETIAMHLGIEPSDWWPGWYATALDVHMDASEAELAEWDAWRLSEWWERVERYSGAVAVTITEVAA